MKNIREYLSSVAGLIKAQGRVLSMVMTLLILSNCAWAADDYYLLYNNKCNSENNYGNGGCYDPSSVGSCSGDVWSWTKIELRTNNNENNYFYFSKDGTSSSMFIVANLNCNYTEDNYILRVGVSDYSGNKCLQIQAKQHCFVDITLNTSTGKATVKVHEDNPATIPTVRIGNQIKEDKDNNVIVSGYVAKTGCANISKFTVYYSKSPITNKDDADVYKEEISVSNPAVGSLTDLTIPAAEIATHNWGNEDMYVRITATNSKGESELSDEVILPEYSPQLSGTDITGLNFNDCEGSHQFNFSEMFKFNVDSWSAAVTDSDVDATSDFELTQEGYMVWNTSGKEPGDYSYTFTAYKSGSSATALLTFTYSAKAKLNDITIVSGETPTYPYIKIDLKCSVDDSVDDIEWSVDNNGLVVRTGKGTAYFKGKAVNKPTTYTISAVGLSATCGKTEPKTIEIVVNPEPEEVCTPN